MNLLNYLGYLAPALAVAGVGIFVYYLAFLRSRAVVANWEARMLADNHHISPKLAGRVVRNKANLEELDAQAWGLVEKYGVDFQTACQIRDGQLDIQTYLNQKRQAYLSRQTNLTYSQELFPFKVNPTQTNPGYFHVNEMGNEPGAYIDASLASAWAYTLGNEMTHLILSGHANGPVCSALTSLLMNTYLSMDSTEETLLVPGACMLRGPAGASHLTIKQPEPKVSGPFSFSQIQQLLLRKEPTPWQKIRGNLDPFENDTGLVRVYQVEGVTYWQIYQDLVTQITAHRGLNRDVLLRRNANGKQPNALFIPFFPLANDNLEPVAFELPLSLFESDDFSYLKEVHQIPFFPLANDNLEAVAFELPLSLFESDDFFYLREVHQRAILIEMTNDAMSRKRIYEEWLDKDEKHYKEYGIFYQKLTPEQRKAKKQYGIKITHKRDFLSATEVKKGADEPEEYISPEEHYTQNLPSLIETDKKWIADMEKLIGDIDRRDKSRDERLEEINMATLIDSFLRGWPSIFLPGEEGRERYKEWCNKKRERVWRFIHRQLETRQMRLEPLLENNTIFQVQFIGHKTLRLKPLHLITNQNFLIYLSPRYGMTYYVNNWSRRELIHAPKASQSNLAQAKEHYCRGAAWLDKAVEPDDKAREAEIVQQGLAEIRLALEYQPLYTAQQLWDDWWTRFARDTSSEFEVFKNLIRGIQAHSEDDYETSAHHLKRFIEIYPYYLPDPYVLLAIQELQIKFDIVPLLEDRKHKINQHTELVDSYRKKKEFLDSNQGLLERLTSNKLRRQDDDPQQIADVVRVLQELPNLKTKLVNLKEEIEGLNEKINTSFDSIWNTLKIEHNHYLSQACELDPTYVEDILKERKIKLSETYWRRFQPLREVLEADEYIHIAETLAQASFDLKKGKMTIEQLKGLVDTCLSVQYIKRDDLRSLQEFRGKKLDAVLKMDAIVRELVLKQDLDWFSQDYFKEGLRLYKESVVLLSEFTEPTKQLTTIYARYRHQYRTTLQSMVTAKVPLRNFAPAAKFIQLDHSNFELKAVWFGPEKKSIIAQDKTGGEIVLTQVEGLAAEEAIHLQRELSQPDFIRRAVLGMSTVEKVLNCSITPSPRARRWGQAIQQLESLLIRVIAYGGRLPIPNEPLPDKKVMDAFEGHPAVDGVRCDLDLVQTKFLNEIGVEPSNILIVNV